MVSVLILGALLLAPRPPASCRAAYDPKTFPVTAAGRLEQAGIFGGVFTQDLWGGYLIYRQYPRGRVFIDGRSDFYGADFARSYIRAMRAQAGWERQFGRFHIETVLLPPDAPLSGALRQSSDWHLVYDDGVAVIFRLRAAGMWTENGSAPPPGSGARPGTEKPEEDNETALASFLERQWWAGPD